MFAYTWNNHFEFGYDDGARFLPRANSGQKFVAKFGRCRDEIISWRKANILACREIEAVAQGPIWVLFSGGTDSEICVRSFLEAKVPIRIATLRLGNQANAHDLDYAEKFAQQMNLPITYFDLDMEKFWESGRLLEIVDPIQCVSPILAAHLWLANQLDGTPVIAQGEPHLKKDVPPDYIPGESPYLPSPWRLVESERLCSLYTHFILQDRPAVPGFFQYLPEQFYSYLIYNRILKSLIENRMLGKLGTRSSKNQIARQFYPEVEERPKFTGFEKIESWHDQIRATLAERFPHSDDNFYIEYFDLISLLKRRTSIREIDYASRF